MERSVVERVAGAYLNAPIAEVTHLPSSVHEVFLVSSAQEQVVARFNAASELGRLQKEAWCIARAAEVGVLGPTVMAVGTDGGYAFMLQSFVPGRRGDVLAGDERRQMWHSLGGHLRRIHAILAAGFGEELTDLTHDDRGAAWQRYLAYNLSSLTPHDRLIAQGVLDAGLQAALRSAFNRLAAAKLRFGLSHGDPSPWNVILGDDGGLRVLDWSEAHAHVVPHYDLGVVLDGRLAEQDPEFQTLLAGYGWGAAAYADIRREVLDLRLVIATDKVRWALDRKPKRFADKVTALQSLLRVDASWAHRPGGG